MTTEDVSVTYEETREVTETEQVHFCDACGDEVGSREGVRLYPTTDVDRDLDTQEVVTDEGLDLCERCASEDYVDAVEQATHGGQPTQTDGKVFHLAERDVLKSLGAGTVVGTIVAALVDPAAVWVAWVAVTTTAAGLLYLTDWDPS